MKASTAGAGRAAPSQVTLAEKRRFLSGADAYGLAGATVEIVETHMSYVFLVGDRAYKFKKPIVLPYLDFSTLAAREANCRAEMALNARLAPGVYLGVAPLTLAAEGGLKLGGEGPVVEWLVVMRRLPEDLMLDRLIAARAVTSERIENLALRLARFFRSADSPALAPGVYFDRIRAEQDDNRAVLTERRFAVDHGRVPVVLDRMDAALRRGKSLLENRAETGRLVDGHGDLKPEHICFNADLDIFDCLEFSAELRLGDPVEELAYLGLECELLGAPDLGGTLFKLVRNELDDDAPERLYHLHFARKGLLRTRLMLAHLLDPAPRDPEKWEPRASLYLALAEKGLDRFDAALRAPIPRPA